MSPPDYAQKLWTKALKYAAVYTEDRLKGTVIKVIHESIRQSIRIYRGNNVQADLQELARHGKKMASFGAGPSNATTNTDKPTRNRGRGGSTLLVKSNKSSSQVTSVGQI